MNNSVYKIKSAARYIFPLLLLSIISCSPTKDSESPIIISPTSGSGETAEYIVTLTSTWSSETHPQNFPVSPHYSRLIIARHNNKVSFWEKGKTASNSIESMAETGATTPLANEIKAAFDNENSETAIIGSNLSTSPSSTSITITVSKEFPFLTLVTMIAPSPDWFTGISNESLLDQNNHFIESKTFSLFPYDAGTDSGVDYGSANKNTNPKKVISLIENGPFKKGISIGTLVITKNN